MKHVPTKIQKLMFTQQTSATIDEFVHFWTYDGELFDLFSNSFWCVLVLNHHHLTSISVSH